MQVGWDLLLQDPSVTRTIFVPSDDAFANLQPPDLLDKFMDQAIWGTGHLFNTIANHQLPGTRLEDDFSDGDIVVPASEAFFPQPIVYSTNPPQLEGPYNPLANIIEFGDPDINGVVHVIDQVLTPISVRRTVFEAARESEEFDIFLELLELTGVDLVRDGPGPFTVFFPPDSAFEAMGSDYVDELRNNLDGATTILFNHFVTGQLLVAEDTGPAFSEFSDVGFSLSIDNIAPDGFTVNDIPTIANGDRILVENGIVHILTDILLPEQLTEDGPPPPPDEGEQ